jgi:hypothetical protein
MVEENAVAGEDVVRLANETNQQPRYITQKHKHFFCLPVVNDSPESHKFANGVRRSGVKGSCFTLNGLLQTPKAIRNEIKIGEEV